jgi:hypothetical protein
MPKAVNIERRPMSEMTPKQKAALDKLWNRLLQPKETRKPGVTSTGHEDKTDDNLNR